MSVIPDRYKRRLVIAGTQLLPQPLRVEARRHMLWSLQASVTSRADTVIVVHPKSGGTWLRTMLFRVYQQKYGLSSRRVMKTDELQRLCPDLPRFVVSNGYYSYEAAMAEELAEHRSARDKDLVLFARHPGDIAVSWYIQFTRRMSAAKRELIVRDLRQPVDHRSVSLWDFVMHPELGLPALIDYHNRWADVFAQHDHGLILRYEDLRAEPHRYLRQLVEHLGETVTDEMIEDAVQFASFDNMRKLEAENYFPNSSHRQKKRGDPRTVKVRRGKVGGFRDDLEPEQVEAMEAMIRKRLNPVFGYSGVSHAQEQSTGEAAPG